MAIFLLPFVFLFTFGNESIAQEIKLRSGKVIEISGDVQVSDQGIRLANESFFRLDLIRSVKLPPASQKQQAEIENLISQYGDSLFRIRVRIHRNDIENLPTLLEKVDSRYESGSGEASSLVHIAKFLLANQRGEVEQAIESFFHLHRIANTPAGKSFFAKLEKELGQTNLLGDEGYSNLIPFSETQSVRSLDHWDKLTAAYRALPKQHDRGLDYYFFLVTETAGKQLPADLVGQRLKLDPATQLVLDSNRLLNDKKATQSDFASLSEKIRSFDVNSVDPPALKANLLFQSGRLQLKSGANSEQLGLLSLLFIHANYRAKAEAVSAGSLFYAIEHYEVKNRKAEAERIKKELLSSYPSSIFANRFKMKD